jgi:hypothetical protein
VDFFEFEMSVMKVSGFTIIRNAVKFDFPIIEAIESILPLCNELVVVVGNSDDGTLALIKNIESPKIRVIESVWDDGKREGGRTFAIETDRAFQAVSSDSDWAFYIQADEVVHEKYHSSIRAAMLRYKDDQRVEGFLFDYKHFYGSYDYVGDSWQWYRREIRIIKNNKKIFSYRDAQGFRKQPNEKLNVKLIEASIYHYGWVKDPRTMQKKVEGYFKYYYTDDQIKANVVLADEYDFGKIDSLSLFTDTHPTVMMKRINRLNWKFNYDISRKNLKTKEKLKRFIKKLTGIRIGEYQNYKII